MDISGFLNRLFGVVLGLFASGVFYLSILFAFATYSYLQLVFALMALFGFVMVISGFEDIGYYEGGKDILEAFRKCDVYERN